jgi:hypothetical protein
MAYTNNEPYIISVSKQYNTAGSLLQLPYFIWKTVPPHSTSTWEGKREVLIAESAIAVEDLLYIQE